MSCKTEHFCDCCRRPCDDCRVLVEFRTLRSPGGRERLLDEYRAELAKRLLEREQQATPGETAERLRRAGFSVQAVAALRDLQPRETLEEAKRFVTDRAALFLLLLGAAGQGKTVAAAYVAQDVARRFDWDGQPGGGLPVEPFLCVQSGALTRLSAFEKSDDELLHRLERTLLLVVDDMGDEGTEMGRSALVDLLIRRHAKGRRSVLTSNLRGEAFKTRYGAALADRIRSSGFIWEGKGASLRRRFDASEATT